MIILAIDTTGQRGGAGIFSDGETLAVVQNEKPANLYSVTLFEMVDRALTEAALTLRDIDLYSVSNGPGSFTGIRVGLAAAQGWARAFGRPAVGVSNLRAMVESGNPAAGWALPLIDARRGEFFLGAFRRAPGPGSGDGSFTAVDEGTVVQPSDVPEVSRRISSDGPAAITWLARESDGAAIGLRESLRLPGSWTIVSGVLLPAIARIGARARQEVKSAPLDELRPRYIRRSDAELNWRE